jgi:hypothetical protein
MVAVTMGCGSSLSAPPARVQTVLFIQALGLLMKFTPDAQSAHGPAAKIGTSFTPKS